MVLQGSCSSLFAHLLNFFWLAMVAARLLSMFLSIVLGVCHLLNQDGCVRAVSMKFSFYWCRVALLLSRSFFLLMSGIVASQGS